MDGDKIWVFRSSTERDAEAVSKIYDFAREDFRKSGIPQWLDGSPNMDTFLDDVKNGSSYVIECDGEIAATAKFILYEPVYDDIFDGEWKSNGYIAVHRVAVAEKYRRMGLAGKMLGEAERYARSLGREAVRIDTHEKNVKMRSMLEKNGFLRRGTVYIADGSPRVAYEKLLASLYSSNPGIS